MEYYNSIHANLLDHVTHLRRWSEQKKLAAHDREATALEDSDLAYQEAMISSVDIMFSNIMWE